MRDPNGDSHYINPAQVGEITLHGTKQAHQGAHIVTMRDERTTTDPWLGARPRADACARAT